MGQDTVKLWHKETSLDGCDFIVLPGGFSYGDYLRSGAIARFSPIMDAVIKHAEKGGYVMGICNGFQVLTESNLLPGALLQNTNQRFTCKNQYIKPVSNTTLLTAKLDMSKPYNIPIAHAEGQFFADKDTLNQLNENDQVMFRYCDAQGNINDEANPNGSLENIAGICNTGKNVFGMMPHPERAADMELGNVDGKEIFDSILALVEA